MTQTVTPLTLLGLHASDAFKLILTFVIDTPLTHSTILVI